MIHRISNLGLRAAALAAVAVTVPALYAATPVAAGNDTATAAATTTSSLFNVTVPDPTRDFRYQPDGVSSSSSSADDTAAGERNNLAESFDAGTGTGAGAGASRRSYGNSRYSDRMHNSDGSSRIALVAGAGINVPVGNTGKYYTPHFDLVAGGGINFNKMFGVLGEFHYDRNGLTGGAINYQYNNYINNAGATPDVLAGLDANAHTWAFTVNPIVNFTPDGRGKHLGGYVTAGIGYYKRTTNFTLPQQETACSTFFCESFVANETFDQYSAGGFGANFGLGITYKLSEFSSERLFMEARYDWAKLSSGNNQDFFPYNRANANYIPVTVGIRF